MSSFLCGRNESTFGSEHMRFLQFLLGDNVVTLIASLDISSHSGTTVDILLFPLVRVTFYHHHHHHQLVGNLKLVYPSMRKFHNQLVLRNFLSE